MDQVADVGLKADVKRLGEHRLNESFGEFRHFIVEKHAYNLAKTISGISDFKEVSSNDSAEMFLLRMFRLQPNF